MFVLCFDVAVHEAINNSVGSILPAGVQKRILDGIFSIGRAQLSDFVLNENNPLGSSRLDKVRRIFEGGESLQLQFPAEDLGFKYGLCYQLNIISPLISYNNIINFNKRCFKSSP